MLTLTENALRQIAAAFPQDPVLRLDISPRGCGAPVVTVAPARATPHDLCVDAAGKSLCVDKALARHTRAITLDCCNGRFTAAMEVPVTAEGCGLCPASPLQGGTCGLLNELNF